MTTDTPAAAPTAERTQFERAFLQRHPASADLRQYSNGEYVSLLTDAAWDAWQARAALSAPVAAQPAASGVRAEPQEVALLCAELCAKSLPTPEHDAPRHWEAYREAWGMRQRVTEEIIRRIAERFHFDPAPYIGTSLDAAMRTHLSTALTGAAKE